MATFALSSSTPYPTLDGAPCPARGWRRIPPPVIRRQSQNQWLNDPLLVHLVRRGSTRTCLCRNHSHLTGGVVANVVGRTADDVRGGDLACRRLTLTSSRKMSLSGCRPADVTG